MSSLSALLIDNLSETHEYHQNNETGLLLTNFFFAHLESSLSDRMMLQTNSVRNLQYDSDLRIAQPPMPIEPVVYQSNQSIVSSYGATQNVSTVESTTASSSTLASYLPKGGITLLNEIPSCHIHQVFELNDCKCCAILYLKQNSFVKIFFMHFKRFVLLRRIVLL